MHYRQDIQGIRAIAVLSVVVFHAWPGAIPGGYTGVDIFFVLSGFLITSILVRENTAGSFSLVNFYRRRARRILPALFVLIIATFCCGAIILSPQDFRALGKSSTATLLFASNIENWKSSDYFAAASQLRPLLHTWSLAVEEQFYIFYPVLMYWMRGFSPRSRVISLTALAFISLVWSIALVENDPSAGYYLPQSRAFELLLGGITACMGITQVKHLGREVISVAAAGMLALSFWWYGEATPFPGVAALLPCVATCMLLSGADGSSVVSRVLQARVLQFFGALSYSLYLWHWPLLSFAHHLYGTHLPAAIAAGMVVLAAGCAYASFRWIEQPFLSPKSAGLPHFTIAGLSGAVLLAMSASVFLLHGLPQRFDEETARLFSYAQDFNPRRLECHRGTGIPYRYETSCFYNDPHPSIAVWGDSHGVELSSALAGQGERKLGIRQITYSACPPSIGFQGSGARCAQHNETVLADLINDQKINTVILAVDAQSYGFSEALAGGIKQSATSLKSHGKQVIVIGQIPDFNVDPPSTVARAQSSNEDATQRGMPIHEYRQITDKWSALLASIQDKPSIQFIDPSRSLCINQFCSLYRPSEGVLYFNRNHLSNAGAAVLARQIKQEVGALTLN